MSGNLWFKSGLDNTQLKRDTEQAKTHIKGLSEQVQSESKKMDSSFSGIGAGMAAIGGTTAIGMLGKQILDTTAKFEKFGIVLKNTLGDIEGNAALDMIAQFAATTPFQLDEVTAAFIKMANQGFVPTREEMVKLGDVASSTGKSFDQLTEALLDAQTGQFERLKEFGIKASAQGDKVTFSFKEQQTTVDNTNSSIQKYILSLGDLKGVQGANALISASLTGQISNLEDKLAAMYNNVGKSNSGFLYAAVGGVTSLIDNYETIGKIILGLVGVYGSYKTAIILTNAAQTVQNVIGVYDIKTKELQVGATIKAAFAQTALNKAIMANPYAFALAAVVALVAGIAIYVSSIKKVSAEQKMLEETTKSVNSQVATETINLDVLGKRLLETEPKSRERIKLVKELNEKYPELLAGIDAESASVSTLSNRIQDYIGKMTDNIRLKVLYSKITEKINSLEGEKDYTKRAQLNEELDALKKQFEYQQLVVQYGEENAKLVARKGEIETSLANSQIAQVTYTYSAFEKIWKSQNSRKGVLFANAKAEQDALNKAYSEYKDTQSKFNENNTANKDDLAKIKKIENGDAEPKDGDEKTENGVKYVFRGGKWVPVSETPAQRKARLAQEARDKKDADNKLLAWQKEVNENNEKLQNEELALLRSKITDKKDLIDLDYEQTLEKIQKDEDAAKKSAELAGKTFDSTPFDTRRTIAGEQRVVDKKAVDTEDAKLLKEELDALFEKYKTFNQKKLELDKEYENAKIKLANNPENLAVATETYKANLKALQDELLKTIGLQDLYQGKGADFLNAKIKAAMPLFTDIAHATKTQLEQVKTIISGIEVTPEQKELLISLGMTAKEVDELIEKLKKLKEEGNKGVDEQNWKNTLEIVNKLSGSIGELGQTISKMGGAVGEIGAGLSGVAGSMNDVYTAMTSEDPMEVASAGVNGLVKLVTMVADQIEANKKAQEEWNAKIEESAHLLAMAKIEAESYKEANVFGVENPYEKAITGAKQYAETTKLLNDQTGKLANGQVQTGTKQVVSGGNIGTGVGAGAAVGAAVGSFIPVIGTLVGAGIGALIGGLVGAAATKTVPVMNSLKDTYGSITKEVDGKLELNPQILADYDKLDESTKKLVDNWQEIKAKQEEAQKQMEDNFKSLAGDLGKSLSDALVEAFANGDLYSAIDKFDAKVNEVISNIVQQLIFNAVFQDMFDKLQADMKASFGEGGDGSIVDDIEKFNKDYKNGLDAYGKAITAADEAMKNDGMAGFSANATRTATSKGIATASQDSVDENNGRLTSMNGLLFTVNESVKVLAVNSPKVLETLMGIKGDTANLIDIKADIANVKQGISDINIKGIFIKV